MTKKHFTYIFFFILVISTFILLNGCTLSKTSNEAIINGNLAQQVNNGIEKGQQPPDFFITTIDGKQYRLSQFKEEKKPILLYFWASWCPYCARDFSIVKNIYPKYADKVTFLAIDLDIKETSQHIQQYKNSKGLHEIDFAIGNEKVLFDYQITRTTTKYAIGRNGLILYKGSGVFNEQQWEILLNGLVNS